ncbi:uncharacterized protein RCC_07339 [Ramularia collo-cygni]|uniref:Uncharacterized protein n=1 Tax=Ramularia collo-cygni TaxID=112498 RepID=A0A2D3VCL8_9PEZI|nr:uncharacterized protein RCC_07339 [Ramularia collo-cygni]CZT21476.1 uncharacterized protein RCC_07339 [Ramularia collo-cygni]
MLYPLLIAVMLSAIFNTAAARMVPPWAKDLPNYKHLNKSPPKSAARDLSQKAPLHPTFDPPRYNPPPPPTYASSPPGYVGPASPTPTPESECPFICIDAINECGMRYGDCLPVCPGETPALTPPPCPSATAEAVPTSYLV